MVAVAKYITGLATVDGKPLPGPPDNPPSTDVQTVEIIPGDPDFIVPIEEETP